MKKNLIACLNLTLIAGTLVWANFSFGLGADSTAARSERAKTATTAPIDSTLLDTSESSRIVLPAAHESAIAKVTARVLETQHYNRQPLDDSVASKFLDRYLNLLDPLHMHFLESDLKKFETYRDKLDDLTYKFGDAKPGREIFGRFLERLSQRVDYVTGLLEKEKFEFESEEEYNVDRKKAPAPKTLEEAKELWRKHVKYEVLQDKLNKEKPEEILQKLSRRYARLLKTLRDYKGEDVFELYLTALTHVYDPHSDYLGKAELENFSIGMKLSLFGIGALLQSDDGYCKIRELVAGGPAARSKKLKPNDKIIAVAQGEQEPVDVVDMALNKVVQLIRGEKGTEVRLTVIPADAADSSARKLVTLVREEIKLEDQEAKAKLIELPAESGKGLRVGVIDLPSFYATFDLGEEKASEQRSTTVDVKKLIRKLKEENVDGLILDLRRNGGGSLEEAINLTGLFIKEGPVVQVKEPNGRVIVDSDPDPTVFYDGPMVVLTSRFSASASEILAGALQDYGRALIVGDSATHGKGTVQSLIGLEPFIRRQLAPGDNPGALKITIRKFYRASGSSTQLKGVTPDLVLPSVNDIDEVSESALENPLPWDTIPTAKFEKLNRVQSYVTELKKRSDKRVTEDRDFAYVREDIERLKKAREEKTVSLNEAKRRKEKEEAEARLKSRREERKTRQEAEERVYEITLKNANLPGLPPPVAKTNEVAKVEGATEPLTDSLEESEIEDASHPGVDPVMKEAKRILRDYVSLFPPATSLVVNQNPSK